VRPGLPGRPETAVDAAPDPLSAPPRGHPVRGILRRRLSLGPDIRVMGKLAMGKLAIGLLAMGLLGACAAQRTIEVTSVPPGARVRLDDEIVGTTPIVLPFTYYGTRRVTLYLDGYRTHSQQVEIKSPWYGHFPFDLLSEVVFPVGWKDRHLLGVDLQPELATVSELDLDEVLERADRFRRATPQGPRKSRPRLAPPAPKPAETDPTEEPPRELPEERP